MWLGACRMITRVFRGHLARERARAEGDAKAHFEEIAVFQYHATHAQRAFRGYYSRRYKHDYSARKVRATLFFLLLLLVFLLLPPNHPPRLSSLAPPTTPTTTKPPPLLSLFSPRRRRRLTPASSPSPIAKAYILSVVAKGEELRARLHEHLRAQRDGEAAGRDANAASEFAEVTANLHHLVSTRNIPGVFNSPYMQVTTRGPQHGARSPLSLSPLSGMMLRPPFLPRALDSPYVRRARCRRRSAARSRSTCAAARRSCCARARGATARRTTRSTGCTPT